MADKEIILRGLENLKTKMNNASGGLFQRLENLEVENGKLKQKNKKLKEQLLVAQTNEETFRLEMEEITQTLGLDENTIFDDVKASVRNLKDNWKRLTQKMIDSFNKTQDVQFLEVLQVMQELERGSNYDK